MLFRSRTWRHRQHLYLPITSMVEENVMWNTKVAYPQETAEEPFVEDKACHLQQSDERQLDRVGLPQDGSNGNERRGRAHLCNN